MHLHRIILHIDMDSFFASVEQQANPGLRGKPMVVSGKEGSRSVIVASSKEAKKFGVKAAMMQHEARKLCPGLIFVEGDGIKYNYVHRELVKILKKFSSNLQVFSIDEAFLDLTGLVKDFGEAERLASKMKTTIKTVLGEWLTCSVGLAENKLLAKLASGMEKPNGLVVINKENKLAIIDGVELEDFCGIGPRLKLRLENLGINSVVKLRAHPLTELIREFGDHTGNFLYHLARGENDDQVVPYFEEPEAKSVGRAHTLPEDVWNKEKLLSVWLHLAEATGRELRRKKLFGKTIIFYWRYADFTQAGFRQTLPGYVNETLKIYDIVFRRIRNFKFKQGIRLVGVAVTNLVKEWKQQPLWLSDQKMLKLRPYLDKINDTYGELTIKPAYLLKLKKLRNKVGGFRPID